MATLQFKISLLHSDPLIWRRFQVMDNYRMDRFHQVVQIVMGWDNKHLHEFKFGDRRIGMVLDMMDDFEKEGLEDETQVHLQHLDLHPGHQMIYWYDFGDDWYHQIELEEAQDMAIDVPVCLAGEQACPVEDCGGIPGHLEIIEFVKDPDHSDNPYLREWLPEGYDPTYFSREEVNKELKRFGRWQNKYPNEVSTPWHRI